MSESEIVLQLDESIWEHVEHMEGSVGIQVTEDKVLDLLGALYDIYHVNKTDQEQAQELLIGLTALLVAAPLGQADKVWQELVVKDGMKNFELSVKDVLDGE
jgi:putative protein kinase ArgK-like GTPase of G3E family